jgi:hypothetical protein
MVAEALERSEDLVDSSDDADRRGATGVAKAKATLAVQLRYVVSSVLVGKALIVAWRSRVPRGEIWRSQK